MGSAAGVVGVWTGAQHEEGTYLFLSEYVVARLLQ